MPSECFFHLPAEKKQRIINAARGELSRVPLNEISINKIILAAGIPRGSFYQYFQDKLDLLDFLFQDFREDVLRVILQTLNDTGGDFFAASLAALDATISFGARPENTALAKNVFPYLELGNTQCAFPHFLAEFPTCAAMHPEEDCTPFQKFLRYLQSFPQNRVPEQELRNLLEILITLFRYTVARFFLCTGEQEAIHRNFEDQLLLLKRCLQKEAPSYVEI